MTISPDRHRNIVALKLFVDTHFIDSQLTEVAQLCRLWDAGWIALARTDVTDTELARCRDPAKRQLLEALSAEYAESLGALVWDQSRWDASVWGSKGDEDRLQKVFEILFPGVPDRAAAKGNHVRDAMHVATAVRYGGYAFVTTERRLLNKDAAIRASFDGFRVWHPKDALAEAMERVRSRRALHVLEPERGPLPLFP
jgi:hypothetical protein